MKTASLIIIVARQTTEMKKFLKKRYLLSAVLACAAFLVVISYIHAYRFTHFSDTLKPRTNAKNLTGLDKIGLIFTGIENPHQTDTLFPSLPYQTFIIESDKKLESWFIPHDSAKGTILIYHGYAGNKSQMISRAQDLHAMHYNIAIVGFRGSGNSEGNYTTIGYEEGNDVIASYQFYKSKFPDHRFFLFGSSMGAAAILKALASEPLPVNGVILEYPFASLHQSVKNRFKVMGFPSFPMADLLTYFGGVQLDFDAYAHNPCDYAKKVTCPVLHMAGDSDERVTNEETATVFQNLKTTNKTLHIFKGGGHESFNENFRHEWLALCNDFLKQN
jgi:uncharacterized protein